MIGETGPGDHLHPREGLGLAQQSAHIGVELPLGLQHPPVAHGLVLAGIGFHLGALQCHLAQTHQHRLLAEPQHRRYSEAWALADAGSFKPRAPLLATSAA